MYQPLLIVLSITLIRFFKKNFYEITNATEATNFNCRKAVSQPEGLFLFKIEEKRCAALVEQPYGWSTNCNNYFLDNKCTTNFKG